MLEMDARTLVVIPSEAIEAYERKGLVHLKEYYNPGGFFHTVHAVSAWETKERFAHGMHIIPCSRYDFSRLLLKLKPDVVRAYGGYRACDLACKNKVPGIPVVASVHDTNPELLFPSVRYADLVLCMSSAVAELVKSRGVEESKILLLPNRVDIEVFRPLGKVDYAPILARGVSFTGKHILCIGRQAKQKNLDTVIKALTVLPGEYSIVFIGRGDTGPYQAIAKDLGVFDRCVWLESIPNVELPLWHSWADCFCVPSRWEGFGIVFIEAAACGNPVITSNIAPMNEYLTHGVSAHLVDEYENPAAVAAAIRKVCEDNAWRETIIQGAVRVAEKFGKDAVDALEVSFYKEVLSASKAGEVPAGKKCLFFFTLLRNKVLLLFSRAKREWVRK